MPARATPLLVGVGIALLAAPAAAGPEARARALHQEAIVVDGHNDVSTLILDFGFDLGMDGGRPDGRGYWPWFALPWLPFRPAPEELRTDTDLARMRAGGLDAEFFSIWVAPRYYDPERPGLATRRALAMIDAVTDQVRRHPDELSLATSMADVLDNDAEGKLSVLLGMEGGHAIEDDLATLDRYYGLGARYMTLTWSFSHGWAGSEGDDGRDRGLTDFGRQVVRRMNGLGMLVDVSHASDPTFWDTLEVTRAPVIASHSSARALAPNTRNLDDDMLRAVAENGGVVMVNFGGIFLDPRKVGYLNHAANWLRHGFSLPTTLAMLADHVEHVARVAGVDHVGLGSDFDGTLFLPEELHDVDQLPNLSVELARRGWSDADLRKLLGSNLLRVFAEAERIARETPRSPEVR